MKKLIPIFTILSGALVYGQSEFTNQIYEYEIDTIAELNALMNTENVIDTTQIDTEAEWEALLTDVSNVIVSTEIDTIAEIEALLGGTDIIVSTEVEAAVMQTMDITGNVDTDNSTPTDEGHAGISLTELLNGIDDALAGSGSFAASDITGQTNDDVPDDDDEFVFSDSGTLKRIDADKLADYVSGKIDSLNLSYSASETASEPLDADDSYSGPTFEGLNGGATIAQWEVVYFDGTAGEFLLADADGTGTRLAFGLAVAATTDGNPISIIREGFVRNDAWAWTPGQKLYMGDTAGAITATAPSTTGDTVKEIGFAIDADRIFVDFGKLELTVAP